MFLLNVLFDQRIINALLFTNVPLQPTLDFLKRKFISLRSELNMLTICCVELLELCTKDMAFQFNDEFYKQIYGFAMGNPLPPVLAGLFLEHVETKDYLNT